MINQLLSNIKVYNDPLMEDAYMPVKSITHKYPNRVLLLTTLKCHTYCDFCTRERKVHPRAYKTFYQEGIDYIAANPQIDDVILSGGDPLTLSASKIADILTQLKDISHVKIVRVHTKIPVHYPKKIDDTLIKSLKIISPLFVNIHITSLDELTEGAVNSIIKMREAGFILGSQTVLLRGINDCQEHLSRLFVKLLHIGVKPYYLYQMDQTDKYEKYVVPIDKGLQIMDYLRKNLSGMAVPRYILDTKNYKETLI